MKMLKQIKENEINFNIEKEIPQNEQEGRIKLKRKNSHNHNKDFHNINGTEDCCEDKVNKVIKKKKGVMTSRHIQKTIMENYARRNQLIDENKDR